FRVSIIHAAARRGSPSIASSREGDESPPIRSRRRFDRRCRDSLAGKRGTDAYREPPARAIGGALDDYAMTSLLPHRVMQHIVLMESLKASLRREGSIRVSKPSFFLPAVYG